jgi:hypothetical protein
MVYAFIKITPKFVIFKFNNLTNLHIPILFCDHNENSTGKCSLIILSRLKVSHPRCVVKMQVCEEYSVTKHNYVLN